MIVDGVAYAPHRRADAAGLEADCYVCAFHKAFGPHLAAAALSSRLMDRVAHFPAPGAGARAFEVGTVSAEACAGVAALRSYVEAAAADSRPCDALDDALDAFYEGVALAEAAPLARLLAFLDAAPRATVLRGAGAVDKLPTVAFSHANLAPAAVVPGSAMWESALARPGSAWWRSSQWISGKRDAAASRPAGRGSASKSARRRRWSGSRARRPSRNASAPVGTCVDFKSSTRLQRARN